MQHDFKSPIFCGMMSQILFLVRNVSGREVRVRNRRQRFLVKNFRLRGKTAKTIKLVKSVGSIKIRRFSSKYYLKKEVDKAKVMNSNLHPAPASSVQEK